MKFGVYVLPEVILARSEIRAGLEREKLHGHGAPMLYAYEQKVVRGCILIPEENRS